MGCRRRRGTAPCARGRPAGCGRAGTAARRSMRAAFSSTQSSSWRLVMTQPGSTRVHADAVRAEVAREGARQRLDRRLRRGVARHAAHADPPGDRAEIDDRAAARRDHARRDRLDGEELVLQVDREARVEAFRRLALPVVARVVRGVVDEHADRRRAPTRPCAMAGLQRRDVGDVGRARNGPSRPARSARRQAPRPPSPGCRRSRPWRPAPRRRARSPRRCRSRRR